MSEDKPHGASTIRAKDEGGGAGKWLAGAAIAAVLLGGGYYAWSTYSASPSTQSAQNEAFDTDYQYDPERAGPIGSGQEESSSSIASPDESASAAPASAASAPARTTRRAAAAPAQTVVAEQTIGVTPASAEAPYDDDEIVVTGARRPIWESTPSARRLSTFYPQRALDRGREGEASLQCTVLENGRLDCVPVSETPARAGFGTAAVRVARTFRHAPQLADGSDAAGSAVNLRVVFRMADEDDRRRG